MRQGGVGFETGNDARQLSLTPTVKCAHCLSRSQYALLRCCYVYNRNLLATGKNQLPCKWQVSGNHRVALQTTHSSAAARSLTPWIITCWNGANLSIKDEGMVHDIKQRNNRHLCHFRRVLLNWNTFTNLVEFLFPELWNPSFFYSQCSCF